MATDNEDCGAANIFINATSQRTPKLENIWLVNDYTTTYLWFIPRAAKFEAMFHLYKVVNLLIGH